MDFGGFVRGQEQGTYFESIFCAPRNEKDVKLEGLRCALYIVNNVSGAQWAVPRKNLLTGSAGPLFCLPFTSILEHLAHLLVARVCWLLAGWQAWLAGRQAWQACLAGWLAGWPWSTDHPGWKVKSGLVGLNSLPLISSWRSDNCLSAAAGQQDSR